MPKLFTKTPKHYIEVKGLEVIKLNFVDDSLTTIVLSDDTRVEFSSLHAKTAKKILDENAMVPKWTVSEEEQMEMMEKKFKKTVSKAKKDNKVKVAGLNKKNYSPTTQYLLKA